MRTRISRFLFLLLFMVVGSTPWAKGQVLISLLFGDKLNSPGLEFGLEGGFNFSTIGGMESNDLQRAFNLGLYFDIRLKDRLNLYTGVLIRSRQGIEDLTTGDLEFLEATVYQENGDYNQQLNTFLVPALLKYNFPNRFYIEGGPQFGLTTKAYIVYESEFDDTEALIKEENTEKINKFDVGAVAGFGYKLIPDIGMTLGIKYYHGFLDVYKDRSGTGNRGIYLKANIPIGAAKSEKARE